MNPGEREPATEEIVGELVHPERDESA